MTAKHFPGHGDTGDDCHLGLPVIHHTRQQWETIDRPPFQAAINAGVPAIMTAHISVPALDPSGDPATLSAEVLTGMLREEMGFDGVSSPTRSTWTGPADVRRRRVPVRALEAGADVLLDAAQPASPSTP